jgi:hypothetical protein
MQLKSPVGAWLCQVFRALEKQRFLNVFPSAIFDPTFMIMDLFLSPNPSQNDASGVEDRLLRLIAFRWEV